MSYTDDLFRQILTRTQTVAVVGFSANTARASYQVAHYLHQKGMRVIPVNPGLAGQIFWGETVYADLTSIPIDIDMIDIFRRSEAVAPIVTEALARWPDLQTIWMQLGVHDDDSAATAQARGVDVIQDRCPKIEYDRLFSAQGRAAG